MDRKLSQLKYMGVFDEVAGVIFSHCPDCVVAPIVHGGANLEETLRFHFKDYSFPVFHGAMIGHQDEKYTIPIGVMVEMDADKGTIKMLESATR